MTEREARSPKITHLFWGRLEVESRGVPFKDARLFPGGASEWDWNATGTRHEPGVQPADVEELLGRGVTAVVLGSGFHERLRVPRETLRRLEENGILVRVEQSEKAVRAYNELSAAGERVGALIHSTC